MKFVLLCKFALLAALIDYINYVFQSNSSGSADNGTDWLDDFLLRLID